MAQPLTLMFGPWVPDVTDMPIPVSQAVMMVPLADCENVYYVNGNYQSLPTAVKQGAALPGQCLGAFTAIDQEGKPQIYAGTQTNLYHWNGASWDDVSGGQTFFAASWSFSQFGPDINATFAPPQDSVIYNIWYGVIGTRFQTMAIGGAGFSSPASSASGSVNGVVNQFAIVGDVWNAAPTGFTVLGAGNGVTTTFSVTLPNVPLAPFYVYGGSFPTGDTGTLISCLDDGEGVLSTPGMTGTVNYTTGLLTLSFTVAPPAGNNVQALYLTAIPYRVQWSAIGDQTQWPAPLTNAALAAQSGYEDLTASFGNVQGIVGFPQFGIVFQRFGITRMTYVGGDVVFAFAPYEFKHGAINRNCMLQLGTLVYYVTDEGFYVTDGNSASSIGTSPDGSIGIDQWFKSNVNQAALSTISAGYDAGTRCVKFSIPTGTNALPDTLLIYNPAMRRWTKAAIPTELVWADNTGTTHSIGIFDQSHTYAKLSGPTQAGYLETVDVLFPDGMTRYTTGVRPIIKCADVPTARVGVRADPNEAVKYSEDSTRDPFTKICGVFTHGMQTRARVSSAAASSISGAILYQEEGGPF